MENEPLEPETDIENNSEFSEIEIEEPFKPHRQLWSLLAMFMIGLGAGYLIWGQQLIQSQAQLTAQPTAIAQVIRTEIALANNNLLTALQSNQPVVAAQPTLDASRISADDDPAIGPIDAPITIVEFGEFQWPYCARFRVETLPQLIETYGDNIRFVARDFPLTSIHPLALPAAIASECVFEQSNDLYWEFSQTLYANQALLSEEYMATVATDIGVDMSAYETCLTDDAMLAEVNADFSDARKAGVNSTPTFFINGEVLIGAQPFENFAVVIESILNN